MHVSWLSDLSPPIPPFPPEAYRKTENEQFPSSLCYDVGTTRSSISPFKPSKHPTCYNLFLRPLQTDVRQKVLGSRPAPHPKLPTRLQRSIWRGTLVASFIRGETAGMAPDQSEQFARGTQASVYRLGATPTPMLKNGVSPTHFFWLSQSHYLHS